MRVCVAWPWAEAVSHIVPAIPIHLNPADEYAENVLLPGDPGRALAISQALLDKPKMLNTHRGLWGYTGTAGGGIPVSVQSTGMGGPSAAIIVEELVELGARTLVRVGTCGALVPELALGDLVVAGQALAEDGASRALGAGSSVSADAGLTSALAEAAGVQPSTVASTDLFYDPRGEVVEQWIDAGAVAVEMESATIFRIAVRHGIRAACLLGVSDVIANGARERIGRDDLERLGVRLGQVAIEALKGAG